VDDELANPNGLKPLPGGVEEGCPKTPKPPVPALELGVVDCWPNMLMEDAAAAAGIGVC